MMSRTGNKFVVPEKEVVEEEEEELKICPSGRRGTKMNDRVGCAINELLMDGQEEDWSKIGHHSAVVKLPKCGSNDLLTEPQCIGGPRVEKVYFTSTLVTLQASLGHSGGLMAIQVLR